MEFFKNLDKSILNFPKNSGFLVAYSGGADSTALLHLFSKHPNVRAIHINHGLQSQADNWLQHCQQTCDRLGIELITEHANLSNASENSCRQARYAFFSKHLNRHEILITAHHKRDQSETILLKLLRGTGLKGLSGIEKIKPFAKGYVARPLLDCSIESLMNYLIINTITWIEDTSNEDNNYKRNFIRNKILPSLQSQFPDAINTIARSATNCNDSLVLLNHLIGFEHKHLPIDKLINTPKNLRSTLFYHWLSSKNMPLPDKIALQQITQDFISANRDKQPHYKNSHYQLFRWKNAIYCIENYERLSQDAMFTWDTEHVFTLPNDCGTLTYTGKEKINLIIKFNQTGKKLKTSQHKITKTVKQLFQENNIPIWQRQNTPFIYHNDELVSLGFDWSHTRFNSYIAYNPNLLIH